jgi:hypothetical protein
MSSSKITVISTNRRRGSVSLTIVRKIVAKAYAEYDEARKAEAKAKRRRTKKSANLPA